MSIAFLYAGQGSQKVGMGLDLYEQEPTYSATLNAIDPDETIRNLSFHSDMETLSQTQNTQPCMVAFAIALTETLKSYGITSDYVAGLSLGEYSALYTAGVFTGPQAIDLVTYRGNAMATACNGIDCGMAAVLGLERDVLQSICEKASLHGVVSIANYNCPGQLILSGETKALTVASELCKEAGARRVMPLNVSGAFHSSLMKKAGDALSKRFETETFGSMNCPVIFNTTAKELQPGESIPSLLEQQVQTSVYLEDSIGYLIEQGVTTFIEIGPGKVLSGFIKKIAPELTTYQVDSVESLQKTITQLKGTDHDNK